MKGFGIYVKNNLLEPKHVEAMGESVWLYMWLLDKMTSVNENGLGKVLGGKPVTFEQIELELGISTRTYRRWVDKLRAAGYILTLRTPYGLSITVLKAEKIYGNKRSAKSGTSKKSTPVREVPKVAQPDVPKTPSDASKVAHQNDKNGTSNKDNTVDNTKTITNVIADPDKPVRYGSPIINQAFDFWAEEVGYNIESRVKANRAAASNLIKKHGPEKVQQLIRGVAMTHSDQYAPRIADFCQLQQKLPDLLSWGRRKGHADSGVTVIS